MQSICTDFDGTFNSHSILNKNQIKRNIRSVMEFRKEGNIFGIATGRDFNHIKRFCEKNNLTCDFIIANNGAQVIDNNKEIYSNYMDSQKVKSVLEYIKKQQYLFWAVSTKNGLIIDINNINIIKNIKLTYISKLFTNYSYLVNRNNKSINDIYQIIVMLPKKNINIIMNNLKKNLPDDFKAIYNDHQLISIVNKECNKAKGISIIVNKYGLSRKNVFTVGDYYNDFEMIKEYNGYCIKSSPNSIKKISHDIVGNIEEFTRIIKNHNTQIN